MDSSDIQLRFGAAVRSRRKQLGFSQEELAGRAGLHRTYIADVERGARNLSLSSIEKVARALEISIPSLFAQAAPESGILHSEPVDILLVEDDPQDAELTVHGLKDARLTNRIQVVRDGAEALEFIFCTGRYEHRKIHHGPQMVLLDLYLPKVPGFEVLRRIKRDRRTSATQVVVLTGSARQQDIAESLRLGAEAHIIKPVNFHRLANTTPQLKLGWSLLRPVARTRT